MWLSLNSGEPLFFGGRAFREIFLRFRDLAENLSRAFLKIDTGAADKTEFSKSFFGFSSFDGGLRQEIPSARCRIGYSLGLMLFREDKLWKERLRAPQDKSVAAVF